MTGVTAGLLQARRRIHGVAEECDLHLDGPEFADDHGPAMQRGAKIGPHAEVASVGVGVLVQLFWASKQARTQCPSRDQVTIISSPTYL